MASYVVMVPPAAGPVRDERIVRDGFHWLGFFVPFLWLLWHRLWIEAAAMLALMLGLSVLSSQEGWALAAMMLSLAMSIIVGLEGAALRIAALRRRGWREGGVVEAETAVDAETRYLADIAPLGDREHRARAIVSASPSRPGRDDGPTLGLLGYSGGS